MFFTRGTQTPVKWQHQTRAFQPKQLTPSTSGNCLFLCHSTWLSEADTSLTPTLKFRKKKCCVIKFEQISSKHKAMKVIWSMASNDKYCAFFAWQICWSMLNRRQVCRLERVGKHSCTHSILHLSAWQHRAKNTTGDLKIIAGIWSEHRLVLILIVAEPKSRWSFVVSSNTTPISDR